MNLSSKNKASIPNPALEPFSPLIGKWDTTGTHGMLPGTTLHGSASFEWLENGAFLIMHSQINDPRFPVTTSIIASDDSEKEFYMLTFDDRGISRKYNLKLTGNKMEWWRDAPGFYQRYEALIEDDGKTIIGKGELSKDGSSWEKDLNLTYKRVE